MSGPLLPSLTFTLVFALALILNLGLKFWLATRQARYVAQHRGRVPAAFEGTVSMQAHQRAADYTIAKMRLGILQMAWSAVVLLGWTLLGGLGLLDRALTATLGPGPHTLWQQLALLAAFSAISGLLELPFTLWQTFRLEERFGFNRMTFRLWFTDALKSTLLAAVIGLPLAALILWLMQAAGGLWWLWAWGAWMAFNLLLLLIYPSFIAPLFNRFEPLADAGLAERVNRLMTRCGFAAKGLFVMDGSTRSAHANAYFTGFGASKRVVFYDTLLRQLDGPEVEAVLAHELGHFRHRHIQKRILAMFMLSLAGFALLGWVSGQSWFYTGLGVQPHLSSPNDALALLLFLLVTPVFGFFIAPLSSRLSRRHEFEADAFAVAQTSGSDLGKALLKLYNDNAATLTPDPMFVSFYYSHPPAAERLARLQLAMAAKAA